MSGLIDKNLRTINDLRNLVVDAGHSIVYSTRLFPGGVPGPLRFRSGHPSFVICQVFYPVQSIFPKGVSDQLLRKIF
jgi:hypothetical protein